MIHIKDSASSEGRSPEDTRFPNDQIDRTSSSLNETPTLRAKSPRQTQYAFRNIDLAAREARRVRPFYPDADHPPQQLHGIFNADSWTGGAANNGPVGLNPMANNNINMNGWDTEMSDAQNNSTGLTPQSNFSYNNSSSNTSYSPPNVQDEDSSPNQATTVPMMASAMNAYAGFSPPSDNLFAAARSAGSSTGNPSSSPAISNPQAFHNNSQTFNGGRPEDIFKNMQGWDKVDSHGQMPGMTPGGDWDKMMDSINQNLGWGGNES